MEKYRFLDHTADALFEAFGKTIVEVFENAAMALQEIQVNLKTIEPKQTKIINVKAETNEMLLFEFLQELIYIKDVEKFVFTACKVEIDAQDPLRLTAQCKGEELDPKKHEMNVDAKAITMHQFELKKEKDSWKARVIVDI